MKNPRITLAKQAAADATREYDVAVADIQSECQHDELGECGHASTGFSSMPPLRVCLHCGLTEEGWGCGYRHLTGEALMRLSRDRLYQLSEGQTIRQGDCS